MSTPPSSSSQLPHVLEPRLLPLPGGDAAVGQPYSVVDPWVIDWRRVVASVVRFKWVAILITLVGTGAGVVASRLFPPAYSTHATLWVDVPDVHDRTGGPIQTAQLVAATGWVDLLESHVVLNDVVRRLRLYLSLTTPDDSA